MANSSKFTPSQILYLAVRSKIVQGTNLMCIRPTNDFRVKWMLQDEYWDNMLRTIYFFSWMFVNLVEINRQENLVKGLFLTVAILNFSLKVSGG